MSNSSLAKSHYWTRNHSSRNGAKIQHIIIHHMAGNLTARQCYNVWKTREASAHYAIDTRGNIGQLVDEKYRAWSVANAYWDARSVTIECANITGSPSWKVSDATINACIKLVADICKRNGIKKCTYTGNSQGVLMMHSWFMSTACPGPYLRTKFNYICKEVNKILNGSSSSSSSSSSSKTYKVKVTVKDLYIRKGPGTSYKTNGFIKPGVYTIVQTKGDWGKLKSGQGWICLDYAKKV